MVPVFVCLSIGKFASLCIFLSFTFSVCLSLYMTVFLSVCLYVCLSICLSARLSAYLSVCPRVCLPARLPVCLLPVCLFVCLFVCLSVCMSACLPSVGTVCQLTPSMFICLSVCLTSFALLPYSLCDQQDILRVFSWDKISWILGLKQERWDENFVLFSSWYPCKAFHWEGGRWDAHCTGQKKGGV